MAYTPVAGKFGKVTVNGVTLHLTDWRQNLEVDVIDVSGFNSTADADGNIIESILPGLMKGEITIKGKYDTQNGKRPMTAPVNIRPGLNVTALLGFTQTHGFTVIAMVTSVNAGTNVREAGEFEARVRVLSIVYPG